MGLLECVDAIVDPRKPKGVRHPVSAILKAVILGLLAGYTKVERIAYYIKSVWEQVAEPLGFTHWHAPDDDTYRNVLKKIPAESLSSVFSNWIAEILDGKTIDVSVDGKACRGFQQGEDPHNVFMMLNVFAHDIQLVLAQWRISEKEGEPTVLSEHLHELVKCYPGIRLFKGNQPEVEDALEAWFEDIIKKTASNAHRQSGEGKKWRIGSAAALSG